MLIICFCTVLGWDLPGPLCCISHHLVLEHWGPSRVSSSWMNKPLSGHAQNKEVKDLLFVCVNLFPKHRNKIYPEVNHLHSSEVMESLDHFTFSFTCCLLLPRCGDVSQAAELSCCQSLLAPWGMKSHFTCQMLVCSYPEVT